MHEKPCIIITRPFEDAKNTAEFLATEGFRSFIEPVLETILLPEALDKLRNTITQYDGLIVTSRNAIRTMVGIKPDIKIIALGKATISFAKEQGFTNIEYAGKNINELCCHIKASYNGKKFIYASGESITEELTQVNCGNEIVRTAVYKTIPLQKFSSGFQESLIKGNFQGIMFLSNKTAETFCNMAEKEGLKIYMKNLYAFCLSDNIAKSIKEYGFKATMHTKNPNIGAIIKLITKFRF